RAGNPSLYTASPSPPHVLANLFSAFHPARSLLRLCALRATAALSSPRPAFFFTTSPPPTPPLPRRHEKLLDMDPPSSQVMSATDDFQDKTVDECILDFLCCSS
ncbi:unnamed protein product, partial [Urochloa humidicola]